MGLLTENNNPFVADLVTNIITDTVEITRETITRLSISVWILRWALPQRRVAERES